ncbi:DUF4254 domain-containing protein [Nocardia jiangxiensis]|uniref:DUF4254 domain-containing protein n=1 Tax=Nocardia jiangxiensis TaxID=282685 RepID=A0ABW6SDE5_9NOCA|nr:DUF4254 domain-containing protein [Nocardia jiangxiensis]
MTALPSKVLLVQACTGIATPDHPVLLACQELACLHKARLDYSITDIPEIDSARRKAVREVDRWLSASGTQAPTAPFLHTETVGMVIDRIAEYSIAAQAGSAQGVLELHRHYLWQRMSELAVAYEDLASEIYAGRRRVPDLADPRPQTCGLTIRQANT